MTAMMYNYVKGELEPFNSENCGQYVPRERPAALSLYNLYLQGGMKPEDALKRVLEIACGVEEVDK